MIDSLIFTRAQVHNMENTTQARSVVVVVWRHLPLVDLWPPILLALPFRILHAGQLLPACCRAPCSAAAPDPERERHSLCPVQLLPVQPRRPQPRGSEGLCTRQRGAPGEPRVEHIRVPWQAVAPGGAGGQHLLAQRIPGETLWDQHNEYQVTHLDTVTMNTRWDTWRPAQWVPGNTPGHYPSE